MTHFPQTIIIFIFPICILHILYHFHLGQVFKFLLLFSGMHRKSLEAAEHLKDDTCSSDHDETRTDISESSEKRNNPQQQQPTPNHQQQQPKQQNKHGGGSSPNCPNQPPSPPQHHENNMQQGPNYNPQSVDDPEVFRNNSIACLRAKAQEHQAKLLNHGLLLQVRSLANMVNHYDANANNLMQQHSINSINSEMQQHVDMGNVVGGRTSSASSTSTVGGCSSVPSGSGSSEHELTSNMFCQQAQMLAAVTIKGENL